MSVHRQELSEILLAAALLLSAVIARRDRGAVVILAFLSVIFPVSDQAIEGPTLFDVTKNHGLTAADLLGVGGLAWAAFQWFRPRRSSPR